jgi:hypothetical protein
MTLVRRLRETAVSPPHQIVKTTEVNVNDLTDLITVSHFVGYPDGPIGDNKAYCH